MNNEQLARLKAISGKDSYLYQLAQKDALNELKTAENDILDGSEPYGHDKMERLEYMEQLQERADEFRKDDSEPDFLDNAKACDITDDTCEACQ